MPGSHHTVPNDNFVSEKFFSELSISVHSPTQISAGACFLALRTPWQGSLLVRHRFVGNFVAFLNCNSRSIRTAYTVQLNIENCVQRRLPASGLQRFRCLRQTQTCCGLARSLRSNRQAALHLPWHLYSACFLPRALQQIFARADGLRCDIQAPTLQARLVFSSINATYNISVIILARLGFRKCAACMVFEAKMFLKLKPTTIYRRRSIATRTFAACQRRWHRVVRRSRQFPKRKLNRSNF